MNPPDNKQSSSTPVRKILNKLVYDSSSESEWDIDEAERAIESHILKAQIEAYKHIKLSDNGMQEPLKSWLDSYITELRKGEK